jgi:hypothetical protein
MDLAWHDDPPFDLKITNVAGELFSRAVVERPHQPLEPHNRTSGMKKLLCIGLIAMTAACVSAATLSPSAVGNDAVSAAIDGRPNLALASAGAEAFSSSNLGAAYAAPRVNDGVINNSGNSWIPATTANTEFVGVKFPGAVTVAGAVWHGQTGYNGRSGGTYHLQYTTDPDPSGSSTWTLIGTYTYTEPGCATPMPRTFFAFPAVSGVTGLRLLLSAGCPTQMAIQEFEAYTVISNPPEIVSPPTGGTVVEGGDFTFTITITGAESLQWRKNGENIPGATLSSFTISDVRLGDAGSYDVVAANAAASVTSPAVELQVTAAPVYASYTEAVLSANPIHYYPLDETAGTTAENIGMLAVANGNFAGGFSLGHASATPLLGKAPRFDGQPGTWVDLGLFHPGDAISVEAWVRLDPDARPSSYHAIVARWDGSYELDFSTDDRANFVVRSTGNTFGIAVAAAPSPRGQWHHLVGVFNEGVVTIYVNGVKGSEQHIGGVLQNAGPAPDRVMIGATRTGTAGSFNFKGSIDEVAIYDYPLSPAQIRAHYRTAFPAETPELTIEKAVILTWPSFPPGFVLQSADHVEGPYQNVSRTPIAEDDMLKLAIPAGEAQRYYRLIKP